MTRVRGSLVHFLVAGMQGMLGREGDNAVAAALAGTPGGAQGFESGFEGLGLSI